MAEAEEQDRHEQEQDPGEFRLQNLIAEDELAEQMGIKKSALAAVRYQGTLPHVTIGGRVFYVEQQFMAWLSKHAKGHVSRTQREAEI